MDPEEQISSIQALHDLVANPTARPSFTADEYGCDSRPLDRAIDHSLYRGLPAFLFFLPKRRVEILRVLLLDDVVVPDGIRAKLGNIFVMECEEHPPRHPTYYPRFFP